MLVAEDILLRATVVPRCFRLNSGATSGCDHLLQTVVAVISVIKSWQELTIAIGVLSAQLSTQPMTLSVIPSSLTALGCSLHAMSSVDTLCLE